MTSRSIVRGTCGVCQGSYQVLASGLLRVHWTWDTALAKQSGWGAVRTGNGYVCRGAENYPTEDPRSDAAQLAGIEVGELRAENATLRREIADARALAAGAEHFRSALELMRKSNDRLRAAFVAQLEVTRHLLAALTDDDARVDR